MSERMDRLLALLKLLQLVQVDVSAAVIGVI